MRKSMSVLLILPPLTQLNTPYPSITHLTAYLRHKGVETYQADLGVELIDGVMRRERVAEWFDAAEVRGLGSKSLRRVLSNRGFYVENVDAVMEYLRGGRQEMATRFANPLFWQGMHRMPEVEELEWAYGTSGSADRARYLCSLFVKDIADVLRVVDERFELIRYGERICTYLSSFEMVERQLGRADGPIVEMMLRLLDEHVDSVNPDVVGISVPFPGNLLGALLCARHIKRRSPGVKVVMGGGYVNTELRGMRDAGLFDYVDYVTYDDGELPLWRIVSGGELLRTAHRVEGRVVYEGMTNGVNEAFGELPAPTTAGLDLGKYLNFVDATNPMHRLWSDGRWNKMMLAHGCYWAKCRFCDTTLDYIGRFQTARAEVIVDRMERMMEETGSAGFHFVDEAAPPAVLRAVAEEILKRGMVVSYWTNVRFDKSFTPELCYLLARSGCIAVSGGIEVASARVLKLINKGVTVESASECMRNMTDVGIMVHAYLMYGFPTQTVGELMESLTRVRNLFAEGLVQSAFWHRYAMTCHSESGINPQSVGAVSLAGEGNSFANNEIPFETKPAVDWGAYAEGLSIATYNYMRGAGYDLPAKYWFGKERRR